MTTPPAPSPPATVVEPPTPALDWRYGVPRMGHRPAIGQLRLRGLARLIPSHRFRGAGRLHDGPQPVRSASRCHRRARWPRASSARHHVARMAVVRRRGPAGGALLRKPVLDGELGIRGIGGPTGPLPGAPVLSRLQEASPAADDHRWRQQTKHVHRLVAGGRSLVDDRRSRRSRVGQADAPVPGVAVEVLGRGCNAALIDSFALRTVAPAGRFTSGNSRAKRYSSEPLAP